MNIAATAPRRFSFDTEFSSDGRVLRAGESFRQSFTKDEMEVLTAAAFEKGKNEESVRAQLTLADSARRIAAAAETLVGGLGAEAIALRSEAAMIALACARKVAGAAMARFPEEEIIAAIEDAMSVLRDAPRLVVSVSPDLVEPLRARSGEAAEAFGYPGAIVVRADAGARLGDCAIVWGDGAIALDRDDAFARLDAAIERHLAEAKAQDDQGDLFAAKEAPL